MSATKHLKLSSSFNWVYLSPGAYIKGAIEFTTSSPTIKATGMGVLSDEKCVYQANTVQGYTNVKSNGDSLRIWSGNSVSGVQQKFILNGVTMNAPPFNSIDFKGDLDSMSIVQWDYKQVKAFKQTDKTTLYSGADVRNIRERLQPLSLSFFLISFQFFLASKLSQWYGRPRQPRSYNTAGRRATWPTSSSTAST